jgi:hypothetical protein
VHPFVLTIIILHYFQTLPTNLKFYAILLRLNYVHRLVLILNPELALICSEGEIRIYFEFLRLFMFIDECLLFIQGYRL